MIVTIGAYILNSNIIAYRVADVDTLDVFRLEKEEYNQLINKGIAVQNIWDGEDALGYEEYMNMSIDNKNWLYTEEVKKELVDLKDKECFEVYGLYRATWESQPYWCSDTFGGDIVEYAKKSILLDALYVLVGVYDSNYVLYDIYDDNIKIVDIIEFRVFYRHNAVITPFNRNYKPLLKMQHDYITKNNNVESKLIILGGSSHIGDSGFVHIAINTCTDVFVTPRGFMYIAEVNIPSIRKIIVSNDVVAFGMCYKGNEKRVTPTVKEVKLGNNVKVLIKGAFYGCESLETIQLNNGLKIIEAKVFFNCRELREIKLPESVEYIGADAFRVNKSLEEIIIPNKVKAIGVSAFMHCSMLQRVTLGDNVLRIWENAFMGCTSLKEITFNNKLLHIGECAFDGCKEIESIELPDSLISIGRNAFRGCSKLNQVKLGSRLKYIDEGAFSNCIALRYINIPESVRIVRSGAFNGCNKLKKVELCEGTIIEYGAFNDDVEIIRRRK